ncbi:MAG: 2-phosphosulfolactate phosphatase, partial [Thermoguttaceae bacterium]|nr:2-phosphosulfolactate phosphatase [Thermoguttaceae bacterium]
LGGERKGVLIPGFDLGNSPDAYSEKIIAGKTLLFTTTNGTKAILRGSGTIYLACFLNAQAVVDRIVSLVRQKENEIAARNRTADPDSDFLNIDIQTLEKMSRGRNLKSEKSKRNQKTGKGQGSWRHRPDDIFMEPDSFRISMICAGTDGNYTEEDLLLAGCLTERLHLALSNPANGNTPTEKSDFIPDGRSEENAPYSINKPVFLDVQAETVRELWRKAADMPLVSHLRRSRGGQNLLKIGLGKDIQDAALTDTLTTVAEYRLGEIRSATCFDKTKKTV